MPICQREAMESLNMRLSPGARGDRGRAFLKSSANKVVITDMYNSLRLANYGALYDIDPSGAIRQAGRAQLSLRIVGGQNSKNSCKFNPTKPLLKVVTTLTTSTCSPSGRRSDKGGCPGYIVHGNQNQVHTVQNYSKAVPSASENKNGGPFLGTSLRAALQQYNTLHLGYLILIN